MGHTRDDRTCCGRNHHRPRACTSRSGPSDRQRFSAFTLAFVVCSHRLCMVAHSQLYEHLGGPCRSARRHLGGFSPCSHGRLRCYDGLCHWAADPSSFCRRLQHLQQAAHVPMPAAAADGLPAACYLRTFGLRRAALHCMEGAAHLRHAGVERSACLRTQPRTHLLAGSFLFRGRQLEPRGGVATRRLVSGGREERSLVCGACVLSGMRPVVCRSQPGAARGRFRHMRNQCPQTDQPRVPLSLETAAEPSAERHSPAFRRGYGLARSSSPACETRIPALRHTFLCMHGHLVLMHNRILRPRMAFRALTEARTKSAEGCSVSTLGRARLTRKADRISANAMTTAINTDRNDMRINPHQFS